MKSHAPLIQASRAYVKRANAEAAHASVGTPLLDTALKRAGQLAGNVANKVTGNVRRVVAEFANVGQLAVVLLTNSQKNGVGRSSSVL